MRVCSQSVRLGFVRLAAAIAALAPAFGAGCVIEAGSPPDVAVTVEPAQVTIDTDATMQTAAGVGVGAFVQYATGGRWEILTTCDTATSGVACNYDLYVTPLDQGDAITNVSWLNGTGSLDFQSDGTVHVATQTSMAANGVSFDTTAGGLIEVEVILDGADQPRFIYWIGNGVLHQGSPTDPVDFLPSAK